MNPIISRLILPLLSLVAPGGVACAAPSILQQPQPSVAAVSGQSATFAVTANGTGTLRYQWRHLGIAILGATEPAYTRPGVTMADAGLFDVVVTDDTGSVVSMSSRLQVAPSGGYPDQLRLDRVFAPRFALNGIISTVVPTADGGCYAVGEFSGIAGTERAWLVRLRADCSLDPTFVAARPDGAGQISSLAVMADGKVIIVGSFTKIAGLARSGVARLNSDGTLDETFAPAVSSVSSVALQPDGRIIIAGSFTKVGTVARGGIARLNADGSLDADFATGAGFDTSGGALAVCADGRILAIGYFSTFSGVVRKGIARLNSDGSLDATFDPGTGFDSHPLTMAVQSDGKVVAGGYFSTYNGQPCHCLARLNETGALDSTFTPEKIITGMCTSIAVGSDGRIIIGGVFNFPDERGWRYLEQLNADGSRDTQFTPPAGFSGYGYRVAAAAGGQIWVGGPFADAGGRSIGSVARLSGQGAIEAALVGIAERPGVVYDVLPAPGARWCAIGDFSWAGGQLCRGATLLQSMGAIDADFAPRVDPMKSTAGPFLCAAVQADGKTVLVCDAAVCLVPLRLNADGSYDDSFNCPINKISGTARCMGIQADGKLLIGGTIGYSAGDAGGWGLVRLNTDGSVDSGFVCNLANYYSGIYCLAVQNDGKIVVGGDFYRYGNYGQQTKGRIARLNPDGTPDDQFAIGAGFDTGAVLSLAIQPDGKILAGGYFTAFDGVTCRSVARLNTDGTLDTTFDPGMGCDGAVSSLIVQTDGKVLVGGRFTTFGGASHSAVARLLPNGALDTGFTATGLLPSLNAYDFLPRIQLADDGALLVAQMSAGLDFVNPSGLVRLTRDPTQTYADWLAQDPVPGDRSGLLDSAADDGVANVLKYALGVPPLGDAAAYLPTVQITEPLTGQAQLSLVFARNFGADSVRYALEISSDLANWQEVPGDIEVLGPAVNGVQFVRLGERGAGKEPRRFARLKVRSSAP